MPDETKPVESPQALEAVQLPPAPESPVKALETPKIDRRKFNGGRRAGAGTKKGTERHDCKKTYDPEVIVESLANDLAQKGKVLGIKPAPSQGVTDSDRRLLQRIVGLSVEEFNARMGDKLARIADKVADKIDQKLDNDEFKTSELAFVFSVMHDKRMSLDGRNAVQNASVAIQVNNYGNPSLSKEELIDILHGKPKAAPPA